MPVAGAQFVWGPGASPTPARVHCLSGARHFDDLEDQGRERAHRSEGNAHFGETHKLVSSARRPHRQAGTASSAVAKTMRAQQKRCNANDLISGISMPTALRHDAHRLAATIA